MSKVNNSFTTNLHFKEGVSDYLVANGYRRIDGSSGTIYFQNGKKALIIKNDNVDFMVYQDGEPDQRRPGYSRYASHTGIGDLDIFKWMLLLHITDVVPMSEFIRKVRKEIPDDVNGFMVQMHEYFQIADNHDAIPVNY